MYNWRMRSSHFTDIACTVCGSVCDDLQIEVRDGRITQARNACSLAEPWFLKQREASPAIAHVQELSVAFDEACVQAAAWLRTAKYPLIYGLSRSTTEGQRAATALADRIGATIDTTASTGHAASIIALQQVGESTCTLGEVKQRADLVIFWGSDPIRTHPRHIERYCPPRAGRTIVVVDVERTATAEQADLFIPIPAHSDWDALWQLRMLVRGVAEATPGDDALRDLAQRMKAARFGIVFFGAGLTTGPVAHRSVEALLQLVTDLNMYTRFYARRMRRFGDVAGADSVLTWQTGYPFGVNFAAGYPRYNPGEFTGPEMLARGEPDLCVIVGSDTIRGFTDAAREYLNRIPVILLDSPEAEPFDHANCIRFTTAIYGIHKPGTAYRLDEVPIPLKVLLPTELPSDADVLFDLLNRLK